MNPPVEISVLCAIPWVTTGLSNRLSSVGLTIRRTASNSRSDTADHVMLAVGSGAHALPALPPCQHRRRIVYLSLDPSLGCLLEAVQSGADAILPPFASVHDIAHVLRAVYAAEKFQRPRDLLEGIPLLQRDGSTCSIELSVRQLEIGCALAQGKTYEQIGEYLGISVNTVSFHLKELMKTSGLRDRWEIGEWISRPLSQAFYPSYQPPAGQLYRRGSHSIRCMGIEGPPAALRRPARPASFGV